MTVEHRGSQALFQAALAAGEDPTNKARGLKALHQSWAEGARIPSLVRPVVARSWSRAGAQYKDIVPLDLATVRERRESNEELNGLVELFKDRLLSLATQAGNQLVISDSQGYVLWVLGPSMIRRRSDDIGFVAGARWREGDVGTNGIGAAMAERTPQNPGNQPAGMHPPAALLPVPAVAFLSRARLAAVVPLRGRRMKPAPASAGELCEMIRPR